MSASEYWEDDPWLTVGYRQADILLRQQKSNDMWLQGRYFFDALQVEFANILSKKGRPKEHYPEEPYRVTPMTEEEKQIKAERERKKLIAYLNRLAVQAGERRLSQ